MANSKFIAKLYCEELATLIVRVVGGHDLGQQCSASACAVKLKILSSTTWPAVQRVVAVARPMKFEISLEFRAVDGTELHVLLTVLRGRPLVVEGWWIHNLECTLGVL
mmetsp:Transcript_151588/g.486409  ORF Transcript_151588/g.486409 Transcript_151588/m.486409 type:complete len:108 (-) Transcript_151588:220-543(-)